MKQWAGRVVSAATVAILLLTTGCAGFFVYPGSLPGGGSGTGSGTGDFVYVINQTSGQNAGTLVGYSIGTDTLTPVAGSPQSLTVYPHGDSSEPNEYDASSSPAVTGSTPMQSVRAER